MAKKKTDDSNSNKVHVSVNIGSEKSESTFSKNVQAEMGKRTGGLLFLIILAIVIAIAAYIYNASNSNDEQNPSLNKQEQSIKATRGKG